MRLFTVALFSLFLTSCLDELLELVEPGTYLIIESTPAGAQIFQGTINTAKVTPDTVKNVAAGSVTFTLKLTDYKDTTFTVTVTANQTVTKAVTMTSTPPFVDTFTDIQLYERSSTVGFQAVILTTGEQVFSSAVTGDLFYDLTEVKSQHLRTPAPATLRYTDFYNGVTATDLNDGVDAPAYSSTSGDWTYTKAITANTYSFLYTNDLKFVKFKITATGGGTGPSDEWKWIRVSYKINQTARDKRF